MKIKIISLIFLLCIMLFSGCTQLHHSSSQSADDASDVLTIAESEKGNEQTNEMSDYQFETQELSAKRGDNEI